MSRLLKLLVLPLLIGLLAQAAWAKPKVALLRLLKGSATLAGKSLKTPMLANEGQVLKVAANSQVRVQLLGDNREFTIDGASTVTVSKSNLGKQAKALDRGAVAVANGIGNVTQGAVGKTRSNEVEVAPDPIGIKFGLPPKAQDGSWLIEFSVNRAQFEKQNEDMGDFSLGWLDEAGEWEDGNVFDFDELPKDLQNVLAQGGSTAFTVPDLEPGKTYRIFLQLGGGGQVFYKRPFRILTTEEREMLKVMDRQYRAEASQNRSVVPLLELASLYHDLSQLPEAEALMQEAFDSPYRDKTDKQLENSLRGAWEKIRWALDMGPA